jgi:hypothetical protein
VRLYRYVGPEEIAARARSRPRGRAIASAADVAAWLRDERPSSDAEGLYVATFVVDADGQLRVASRHDEHVACAGGDRVWAAGELGFASALRVARATNQSTGYCPEPSSWPALAAALDLAGLSRPNHFEPALEFRRCARCGELAILKPECPECATCGTALPDAWNLE